MRVLDIGFAVDPLAGFQAVVSVVRDWSCHVGHGGCGVPEPALIR